MDYALITGASKGIGRALSIELAKRGKNLLLVSRDAALLKELHKEIISKYKVECQFLGLDLSAPNAALTLFEWCKEHNYNINILINNAGYGLSGSFENQSSESYQNMMQLNMFAPLDIITKFIPVLKKHTKAYILNVASSAAYQSVPGLTVYAATKSFLVSFTRGLRYELRNSSISVTVVCPGATDTDFAKRAEIKSEKALKMSNKLNMTAEDVAKIALDGMFAHKAEVIAGIVNQLGAFAAWLLPKSLVEKEAGVIYGV